MPETKDLFTEELVTLAEGRRRFEGEATVRTLRGERREVLITIHFAEAEKKLDHTLVSLIDITERKRAEEQVRAQAARLKVLADASRAFARSVQDYEVMLDLVARQVADALGGFCGVRLLSDNGEWLEMAAMYDVIPEALEFARMFSDQTPLRADEPNFSQRILPSSQPLLHSNQELFQAYDATIVGWSRAMDLRDKETEGHSQRVTDMTLQLARVMQMDEAQLIQIRRGALLHDMGKLGVPDHILFKTGKLTDEEWEIMRKHPAFAYEMLSPIQYLKPALNIPYCHHEKWDGTGYPRGLVGEQIPLEACIFAVVDVWDALRSDRPYRKAWTAEKAREYIREQAGSYFDPKVVEYFLELAKE